MLRTAGCLSGTPNPAPPKESWQPVPIPSQSQLLAEALLERETLDQIEVYRIAGLAEPEALPVD